MTTVRKYKTNLNCHRCVEAVRRHLDQDASIRQWSVDTSDPHKVLTVEGENLSSDTIERRVAEAGFKVLSEIEATPTVFDIEKKSPSLTPSSAEQKSSLQTYRPLLLVLSYLVGIVAIVEVNSGEINWMRAMQNFMGGFFVAFSFFKLLDLRGFVDSFQSYDVVARPVRAYGFAYPFIELALGAAYLVGFYPLFTNVVTLVVMLVGIIGVSQALLQKRRIQCACLGTVFNLPMSKVTFIEDGVMAAMAAVMLGTLLGG